MKKILQISIGQCGNQIGAEHIKKIADEHGINPDGTLVNPEANINDRKDIFFSQSDDGKYIARSILIDTEPAAVLNTLNSPYGSLYNQENVFIHAEGGGAANTWSFGYEIAHDSYETIVEMVRRETEIMDSLDGFILTHSLNGGTGSGMGSYIMEKFTDDFPSAMKMNYAVFPNTKDDSDVVTQSYNSTLSLRRLCENSDGVVVLDNTALYRLANNKFTNPSIQVVNSLVSTVMAATTATIRFPSYTHNDMASLLLPMTPTQRTHFFVTGYTPFSSSIQVVRKTSVIDVVNRLLETKNIMMSSPVTVGSYINILNIIQGEVDPNEIEIARRQVVSNKNLHFAPWNPAALNIVLSKKSPYVETSHRVSGLMLANHTNVRALFQDSLKQCKKMFGRKMAFFDNFRKGFYQDKIEDDVRDSIAVVEQLIQEYAAADTPEFFDFEG